MQAKQLFVLEAFTGGGYAYAALCRTERHARRARATIFAHNPHAGTIRIRPVLLTPAQIAGILYTWGQQDAAIAAEPNCDHFPDAWQRAYLAGYRDTLLATLFA